MKGNVVGCNSDYYYALIHNLYNSGEGRCGDNDADAPTHFVKFKLRMCICCIGECTYCEYFEHFKIIWDFTKNYKLHEYINKPIWGTWKCYGYPWISCEYLMNLGGRTKRTPKVHVIMKFKRRAHTFVGCWHIQTTIVCSHLCEETI